MFSTLALTGALCCLCALSCSAAPLSAILESDVAHPELVTVTIVNSSGHPVSIVAWNNFCDASPHTVPFQIQDHAGNDISAIRAHVERRDGPQSDIVTIPTSSNFTRQLNVTDYIHVEPGTSSTTMTMVLRLPSSLQGLDPYDNSSISSSPDLVPQDSILQHSGGALRPFVLTRHELDSKPLTIKMSVAAAPARLFKRMDRQTGMKVDPESCRGPAFEKATRSVKDIERLAHAAIEALFYRTEPHNPASTSQLYRSLWHPDTHELRLRRVFNSAAVSAVGGGSNIDIICDDEHSICGTGVGAYSVRESYSQPQGGTIVLCPKGLAYPMNIAPCTAGPPERVMESPHPSDPHPGRVTLAARILHEWLHLYGEGSIMDLAWGAMQCSALAGYGKPVQAAMANAESHTIFASWAADLGFAELEKPDRPCMQNFKLYLAEEIPY
ncbi:MAG: hypothetical protein M1833_001094 [Piccolia ochrophora]|nr:MAG: hypothetical protein M1833_001094 [Piccolia ochrophora]